MTTLSQVISSLQSILKDHGDLAVYMDTGDLVLPVGFTLVHKGKDTRDKRVALITIDTKEGEDA